MLRSLEISLERYPRNILSVVLMGVGVVGFPISLFFSMSMLIIVQAIRIPTWGVLVWGMGLMLILRLFDGLTASEVFRQNHQVFIDLIYHHSLQAMNFYSVLVSLPLAMIFCSGLAWILNGKKGLQQNIKRLASGKGLDKTKPLSEKRLNKKLQEIKSAMIPDGSVLGIDCYSGDAIALKDADANSHTLAVGTTGSGKTTGICNILESCILRQLSVIYVDGKGDLELARRIENFAKSQNVPFYLFSMVGESVKYNPLFSGGITSKKDRIVELRNWSEDHYRKIAEGYLQTVFDLLQQANIKIDLYTLSAYLDPGTWCEYVRVNGTHDMTDKIEKLGLYRTEIQSLIAEIDNMANSEIGHLFNTSSGRVLTLEHALVEKAVVYFCLQPLKFPAYAESLGKLIINDIKALAAGQLEKTEKQKIYTIFDEFSIFAGDQIITLINQGRSAGIHAILSTQSLSDIERKGGTSLVGQILNNCNNYFIYRQNNHVDAEMLSKIIGTQDSHQITSQLDSKIGSTGAGTVRQTKEFIIHPDEIKRLELSRAIFVNKRNFRVYALLQRLNKW